MKNKKILLVMPIKQSTVLPAFSRALTYLGWDYHIFDYRNLNVSEKLLNLSGQSDLATQSMNRRLVSITATWQPKLIFVVKGSVILPEALKAIKKRGILTINWFPDDIQAYDLAKKLAPYYDLFTHFDSYAVVQLKKECLKNVYHFAFAADILPTDPMPNFTKRRKYPITIIGNYYPVREEILPVVQNLGLNIWGEKRWQTSSLQKNYHNWLRFGDVFDVLRQTKIGINIQYPSPGWSLVNRAYDVMTCGAMLLTENKKEAKTNFIDGKNIVIFKNSKELRESAEHYLKNNEQRLTIARHGYEIIKRQYRYIDQFKSLFTYLDLI